VPANELITRAVMSRRDFAWLRETLTRDVLDTVGNTLSTPTARQAPEGMQEGSQGKRSAALECFGEEPRALKGRETSPTDQPRVWRPQDGPLTIPGLRFACPGYSCIPSMRSNDGTASRSSSALRF
jgi:hypothetical protein